jgi:hypothetical protein
LALVPCRECRKKISTEAKFCIGCGAPYPTSKAKEINGNLDYLKLLKDYYNKFIDGKISLPVSFWLVGLIGIMAVSSLITALLYFLNILSNPLLRILVFPYLIIASIGIWQSSDNYKGPKAWSLGAKIMVIVWIIHNILGIFVR